jgi:hypothetical protein
MSTILGGQPIVQNCYIVPNLEAACEQFHKIYGMGPFLGGGEAALEGHVYHGQAAEPIRIKGVFGQSGDMNIELVEVLSDGPCAFTDLFPKASDGTRAGKTGGFHHVAVFCDDYEAQRDALVAAGYPVASEFTVNFGAQICYIDTRPLLGHFIELYPEHEIIRQMYADTKIAAEHWDGTGPLIRPW